MLFLRRCFLCSAAAALLLPALAATPAGAADSVADARERAEAARDEAQEATDHYEEANSLRYELEQEVTELEARLESTMADARVARRTAAHRAIEEYTRGRGQALPLFDADSAIDAARRDTLLAAVESKSTGELDDLRAVGQDIRAEQEELDATVRAQEQLIGELADREEAMYAALRDAEEAEADAEAEAQRQAAASQNAQASSTGGDEFDGGPGQVIASGDWVCPVQGGHTFSDTWGAPRSGGRRHKGTDIMASMGTPLVAVVGGSVNFSDSNLGGNQIWLNGNDGITYFYAHLSSYVGGARSVSAGEVIGAVGDTGNASGTPHLHFEIHPGGGSAVNPYPTVAQYC